MLFNPKISIVIINNNNNIIINESIQSVIDQTYRPIEIVLINEYNNQFIYNKDISSDQLSINIINIKPNDQLSSLNIAFRESKGEYISLLTTGDIYIHNKLEKQIKFINEFELFNSILYSDYELIDQRGNHLEYSNLQYIPPEKIMLYLFNFPFIPDSSLLFPKKNILNHLIINKSVTINEILFNLSFNNHIILQKESLIKLRITNKNLSNTIKINKKQIRNYHYRNLPKLLSSLHNINYIQFYLQNESLLLISILYNSIKNKFYFSFIDILLFVIGRKPSILFFILKKLFYKLFIYINNIKNKLIKNKYNKPIQKLNFINIFNDNKFGGTESVSGSGSTLFATRILRRKLSIFLNDHKIFSIIDIPCGDFNWMYKTNLNNINYIGSDIVDDIIKRNQFLYGNQQFKFITIDILNGSIPQIDCILCRDCFVHLPFKDIILAIKNFKKSLSKWLLATTFINITENIDLDNNGWRPLNLCIEPFNFPKPIDFLNEKSFEGGGIYSDKSLGLWLLDTINFD
jgi:hypothetical protein